MFTDYNNLTCETIESASQRLQIWKSLIQDCVVTILYSKWEANVVAYGFSYIIMVHHAHQLSDTALEEDTCELLCLESLFISNNTYCFSLDINEISFF